MERSSNKKPDALSLKILQELQDNARITAVELGKRIGLSAPAIAERIKKLEDEQYISGYKAILDFDKLGYNIPVFINFKTTTITHSEMVKMISSMPAVNEWYLTTGYYCCLLKVIVASTGELNNVLDKLNVAGETSTSIILSAHSSPKNLTNH
jgi:Lrp/AsnC family leucine-responsive transcriptional regulator